MAFDQRGGSWGQVSAFQREMGRTYVAPEDTGRPGGPRVLDADRVRTLTAWVARLIPGDGTWPSAADTGAVAYIDAVLTRAPALRPLVLAALDGLDAAARDGGFAALGEERQVAALRALSDSDPDVFGGVLELTYEAYYRDPSVDRVVRSRTGFDRVRTLEGIELAPFDASSLDRVRSLPARHREVS